MNYLLSLCSCLGSPMLRVLGCQQQFERERPPIGHKVVLITLCRCNNYLNLPIYLYQSVILFLTLAKPRIMSNSTSNMSNCKELAPSAKPNETFPNSTPEQLSEKHPTRKCSLESEKKQVFCFHQEFMVPS